MSDEAGTSGGATMPVSGVRMSCAIPASEDSMARDAAFPLDGTGPRACKRRRPPAFFLRLRFAIPLTPTRTMARKLRSIEPDQPADVGGRRPGLAQFAQTGCLRRFRELLAHGIEDETMMAVTRLRQAEQRLEQPVDGRCIKQVVSAHDVRDALRCVVESHCKMIARRRFLSREHHISPPRALRGNHPR